MKKQIDYAHNGSVVTPQSAYDLVNEIALQPRVRLQGITVLGDTLSAVSLLYHAAKHANLKIIGVEVNGKKPFFMRRVVKKKEKEWREFLFQNDLVRLSDISPNQTQQKTANKNLVSKKTEVRQPEKSKTNTALPKLEQLIGLTEVKKQIQNIGFLMKNRKDRQQSGLSKVEMSHHLVFTGNPGTGKTTVARLVGKIYQEYGVLKKGHFIEVEGRDLIAEYIGQTAAKTKKIINSALDGVLFIDEAYSLTNRSQKDFGKEAVTTLVKMMEDHRDRLVVIIAGYDKEIATLLDSNPGLKSRFKTKIDFPDFKAKELEEIFMQLCKANGIHPTPKAKHAMSTLFSTIHKGKNEQFGNGRAVRNVFDSCILNQARRLGVNKNPTLAELKTLVHSDIPAFKDIKW